jgi:hypothetical protein
VTEATNTIDSQVSGMQAAVNAATKPFDMAALDTALDSSASVTDLPVTNAIANPSADQAAAATTTTRTV